jgi:glutamate N-acetyltransferase/amino-acid N-acetyltransferase|tara:strand:- start:252 stop:1466 length:1215 start_codon:yes stop_codon:yes gene_type:complete
MAVGLENLDDVYAVAGVRLAATAAGIKPDNASDLALMELAPATTTVGVFTRNAFCAAPVTVSKRHLSCEKPTLFLINSGNANAGLGAAGISDALASCQQLAAETGMKTEQVLPFSTGVIGEELPVDKISHCLPSLLQDLNEDNWLAAARAIMTTDTRPKVCSRKITLRGKDVTISGMAKGSGMIRPDMATLLVFLATDASIESDLLQEILNRSVGRSFNRVTIDSDTSTNDCCMLSATHLSEVTIEKGNESLHRFTAAMDDVCVQLAKGIVKDAEGASKFIEVIVENGKDTNECLTIAYSVAESPLVKTAMFASDANWGRILMAVGKAGVEDLDVTTVSVFLDDVCIVRCGERDGQYREEMGAAVMAKEEICVRIDLARGEATETVWTSDLSHEYVRINAEYRT